MTSKTDRLSARLRRARIGRALLLASTGALLAGAASALTLGGNVDTSAAFSPTNQSGDGVTYYGAPYGGAFPAAPVVVGEFDFGLPTGDALTGATISGNFGSDLLGSATGEVDLFVDGIEVAHCDGACAAASESADVAWSYTFAAAQLGALGDSLVLSALQQGGSQVALDPTAVTLAAAAAVSAVPEPTGLPAMLAALPLVALALRRRGRGLRA